MNRQTKRMLAKQKTQERQPAQPRRPSPKEKRQRTSIRQFLKEVRQELRKVNWPSRQELIAYTIVVLVSVTVLTAFVFGLDYVFSKVVLKIFGGG